MNKSGLVRELKKLNLSSKGKKHELVNRLEHHFINVNGDDEDDGDDDDEYENELARAERLQKEIDERKSELAALRKDFHNSTNEVSKHTPQTTTTVVHTNTFSFRDIEDSMNSFSGKGAYTVKKWISEIEQSAIVFNWSELQRLVYAKKLLKGTARNFLRTIEANTWEELKVQLCDEFDESLCEADVHKTLSETRKSSKESFHDYLLRVCEIGRAHKVGDDSIIKYVINGLSDDQCNKQMLYGATSMKEFKVKYFAYEKFKSEFAPKKELNTKRVVKNEVNTSGEKSDTPKRDGRKCFLCGEGGHIAPKCPTKQNGMKCYNCGEFGHRASECPSKETTENTTEKKVLCTNSVGTDMMCKTIKLNNSIVSAVVDTGCDVNLVRIDAMKCMQISFEKDTSFKLKGAGGKSIQTLGHFTSTVYIDEEEFRTKFYVVEADDIPMLVIIGKELIAEAEVIIRNNHITIRRCEKPEPNFLMNITIDEAKNDHGDVPMVVQEMIREYRPIKTVKSNIELNIQVDDDKPSCHRPRRLASMEKEIVENQIKEWLRDGVIEACASEFSSSVVVVRKKDGSPRVCIDYRDLNKRIIKDRYPTPLIEEQLDALQNAKVFSTIDLRNGFFHVPVHKDSRKYLSFVTHGGQYTFLRTPFGCCNSPRVFQRYINFVFRDLINKKIIVVYMDDIIIMARDVNEAVARLKMVFECAASAGLEIKWSKCQFLKRTVEFLGHIVEEGRIRPSPSKTAAVRSFPEPKTIKSVQSFLGLTGYFRKFIEGYATIAKPLSDMLRKDAKFVFKEEQRGAFEQLKRSLVANPVLKIYDPLAETELHTDASKYGFGAVLMQRDNDDQQMHPVHYMSLKTSPMEEKYDSYMLEVLAIMKALEKFRVYLLGIQFKIVTDCEAFTKTLAKKDVIPKVARMVVELQEFHFTREHRSGNRMKHVDSLSRNAIMMISAEENMVSRIKSLQKDDDEWQHVLKILETQPYQNFVLRSDILYKYDNGLELLVVPKAIEVDVIKNVHENGHFGAKKMEEQIKQQYFIPKLKEKLKKFVKTCVKCILVESKHGKQEGFLHPIEKEDTPLQTYHVDHLGPMVLTCKAYKHIFIVVDAFTKFTWLYPTKTVNSKEVVEKLKLQQTTFGNPRRIVSDKGTAFTAAEFEEFCQNEDIEHVKTTTGMPRANGQVERINRCVIPVLTKLAIEDESRWYKFVPEVQQALNGTYQRSIATTPFKLFFGAPMRRKEDARIAELLEENFIEQFIAKRDDERNAAKLQILRIQEENKRAFDGKRKSANEYTVGNLVAIKRTQFVSGNKLAGRYLGPYRVTRVKANERYDVEKVGHHEGPKNTSTGVEYMKAWTTSEADDEQDGRV